MQARKAAEAVTRAEAIIGRPGDVWRRYAYVPLDRISDRLMTAAQMQQLDAERVAQGREPICRNVGERMAARAGHWSRTGRAVLKQQDLDDGREYLMRRSVR